MFAGKVASAVGDGGGGGEGKDGKNRFCGAVVEVVVEGDVEENGCFGCFGCWGEGEAEGEEEGEGVDGGKNG